MRKINILKMLNIVGVMFTLCFIANSLATVPGQWGHPWDPGYINPLTYYVYDWWDGFSYAVSDWNNLDTDFGSISRTGDDMGPLVVFTYNSSTDGACGFTSVYPTSGQVTTMSIGLNDYYLTHGEGLGLNLPLNTTNKRKSVCAHELGHVQDLWHVAAGSIMVTTGGGRLNMGIWAPTADDKTGVNNLW
jgi:hypothetical protein